MLVFGWVSVEKDHAACSKKGADVVLYDGNGKLCADEIEAKILETKKKTAIQYSARNISGRDYRRASFVVMSPGVPTDLPIVEKNA